MCPSFTLKIIYRVSLGFFGLFWPELTPVGPIDLPVSLELHPGSNEFGRRGRHSANQNLICYINGTEVQLKFDI